uniref:glutathione transferase n=1 Tax=Ditylenchus dipsaci TaxID=166011 RepID=A0A915CVE0_9BILA
MVHYKLLYFHFRVIPFDCWSTQKPNMPFEKVPVLEVDGKPIAQSYAILIFGQRIRISRKTSWDQAKIDEFSDVQKDLHHEVVIYQRVCLGVVQGDKEKLYNETFVPAMKQYLPVYVKTLKESGSGYLMNCGLTWVDFTVANFLTTVKNLHPEELEKFPDLEEYRQRIYSLPSLQNYLKNRKPSIV